MTPACGTVISSRRPADSPMRSSSDKAEVAMATANTKAAALDVDVAAVVAVAAIRTAAVIKDVTDADTTEKDKAVGAEVCTIKGTKASTTKTAWALVTKAVGGGPTTTRTPNRHSLSLRTLKASTTCLYFAGLKLLGTTSRVAETYLMTKAL